ncbi:MAG TPA: efflux RND transporter periplasmic adaptor subunit [Candidatus Acidoferrum sp.]|nr:efflux RND transporter periplasmic adaptor subunit [Candidatus Acidoferrum sp.]
MKTGKKIAISAGALVVLGTIVLVSVYEVNKGVVTVQTADVVRQDLTSIVTASGEVRPKNYTNILGEGFGKITDIAVKEGDKVRIGDVLLHIDSIQPAADVRAQQATLEGAEASSEAATAGYQAAVATLAQRQSDLEKAKLDWQRSQSLYTGELIAKSDYDAAKATYDSAVAALKAAQATLDQMRDSSQQSSLMVQQARAVLAHQQDVLRKTTYRAPINGIVSFIPVRVGENVVPGIQNAEGSFLMTISDMSIVTAEVMVDETDITNLRDGQPADVTVDALPNKTLHGIVTEVGDLAILRQSGQAATQQTTANTQEARDFKVVVRITDPPLSLRPGLSCTAKIQTAHRDNALSIPIQAVAVRTQEELNQAAHPGSSNVTLAATAAELDAEKKEIQGVFVVRGNKAVFVPVKTGITGTTNIEVTDGLKAGDQIVTGSYQVLRTLKPGATIKVDNSLAKDEGSST